MTRHRPARLSVHRLPVIGTLITVLTATAFLSVATYHAHSRTLTAEWKSTAVEQARLMAVAIRPWLDEPEESLAHTLTQMTAIRGVHSVTLIDEHGVILADTTGQRRGRPAEITPTPVRPGPDVQWLQDDTAHRLSTVLMPILSSDRPSDIASHGAVLVRFDASVLDRSRQSLRNTLVLFTGSVTATATLAVWLITWTARRRATGPPASTADAPGLRPDQTERTWTDAERIRRRLDQIYASLPIGLLYINAADLTIDHVSQSLAFLHGEPVDAYLGQPLSHMLSSDRWSRVKPILEQVIKSGVPYHGLEDTLVDPRVPERVRSVLCDYYPDVDADGQVQGIHIAMIDITAEKEAQQERERDLRELMAKNRELDQMAIRDPLTGLYNRRFFDEALTREWQQFQRSGEAFTVIIMDVDAFKAINDDFGHEAGDRGLQQVAATLKANLRESDLIARVGGDEFAALLPRTDAEQSQQVAEKLSEILRTLRLATGTGDIPMSLSLGAATVPGFPPVTSAAELLRVADKRMYEAKRLASSRRADAG